jgi:hypothetical protein
LRERDEEGLHTFEFIALLLERVLGELDDRKNECGGKHLDNWNSETNVSNECVVFFELGTRSVEVHY